VVPARNARFSVTEKTVTPLWLAAVSDEENRRTRMRRLLCDGNGSEGWGGWGKGGEQDGEVEAD